jgi:hypothetical protein
MFGGIDGDIVWVGGPPTYKMDDTNSVEPYSPLCWRKLDPKTEISNYKSRVGLYDGITKFKKDDSDYTLTAFAADALEHMRTHGMDSVFYMKGCSASAARGTSAGAVEIFNYHSSYTKQQVKEAVQRLLSPTRSDPYVKAALSESGVWLTNSLHSSMKVSLKSTLAAKPSGPDLWMAIVSHCLNNHLRRLQELEKKFNATKLSDFPGENVEDYCLTVEDYLIQLDKDDHLPKDHLLTLVDRFTDCTVMDFKIEWMAQRPVVQKFIRNTAGKSKATVEAMPDRVTFQSLLETARESYKNLQPQWGPTANTQVANTAEIKRIAKLEALVGQLRSQIAGQTSSTSSGSSSSSDSVKSFPGKTCHGCGAQDMIRPHCPVCKGTSKDKGKGKTSNSSSSSNPAPGKWAAPKKGESEIRVIDGVTRKYCAKCRGGKGFWTKNHVTSEHQDDFKSKTQTEANVAAVSSKTVSFAEPLTTSQVQSLSAFLGLE